MWPWCLSPVRVAGGCAKLALSRARACSSAHRAVCQPLHDDTPHQEASQRGVYVPPPVMTDYPLVHRVNSVTKSDSLLVSHRRECGAVSMSVGAFTGGIPTATLVHDRTTSAVPVSMLAARFRAQGRAMSSKKTGVSMDAEYEDLPDDTVAGEASGLVVETQSNSSEPVRDRYATQLRQLLSWRVADPLSPISFTARMIRSLYVSVKSRSMLRLLSSADQSALISLFGSLSLSTSQGPYRDVYSHPFTLHMQASFSRTFWPFVIQIAKDKHGLGRTFSHSDRYWLMRAHLAELQTPESDIPTDPSSTSAVRSLQLARQHYGNISRHSDFNIHYPYLQALMARPTSQIMSEVVPRLCELLGRYEICNPRLLALLWQAVLRPEDELLSSLKQVILLALWRRQCDAKDSSSPDSTHGQTTIPDNSELLRRLSNMISTHSIDVTDLAIYLRHVLFSRKLIRVPQDSVHHVLSAWAQSMAGAVLTPEHNTAQSRWDCVVLLALFSSPLGSGGGKAVTARRNGTWSVEIADWHVICALASLAKLFPSVDGQPVSPTDDIVRGVSRILETLWSNWTAVVGENGCRPFFVSRAICATFLRLAEHVKNKALGDACRQYCDSADLWTVAEFDVGSSLGITSLAQEYLFSSLSYGARTETALAVIMKHVNNPGLLSTVVNLAISRLCSVDVEVAQGLWISAQHASVNVSADTVVSLAVALIHGGLHIVALQHLDDVRLTPQQRLQIVHPLLLILSQDRYRKVSPQLAKRCGDVLLELFPFQAPHARLRCTLEYACLTISRSGYPSGAVAVVEAILAAHPTYFRQSLFRSLIRLLLAQRHFRLAERMFNLGTNVHPDSMQSMQRQLIFLYCRGGAGRLALRMAQRTPKSRLGIVDALSLACAKRHTEPSVARTLSLKVQSILARQDTDGVAHSALHLLNRIGRLRAAKRLYGQTFAWPQSTRTILGNDILHASLQHRSRKNAQRMRKGLETVDDLVKRDNFTPDRVTVNILMKALMWWRTDVDSTKLRVLFDRMVQNGYPVGGVAPRGTLPFGTDGSPSPQGFDIPKMKSSISFARHVRPLYKMFIKAFYIRGDAPAARTVVRILHAVQAEEVEALERRETERVAGRRNSLRNSDEGRKADSK